MRSQKRIRRCGGFTLVELVVTIMLIGIMAVVAIPRLVDTSGFEQRGVYDQTLAALRYAQKTAIAQRRTVCASVSGAVMSLKIAMSAKEMDCSSGNNLTLPFSPQTATGLSDGSVIFYSSGAPNAKTEFTIGSRKITVEADTGYVH